LTDFTRRSNTFSEIQFDFRVHMLPLPKNIFGNVKKTWPKFLHLHIHNLSTFVQFRQKSISFVVYVKKTKNCNVKCLIFNIKFCFFTHATWYLICRATTLWACSTRRCTCKLFVLIFWHFKICQICISKYWKHMLPRVKTSLPYLLCYQFSITKSVL
jgi:hypothetical protein